MAVDVVTSLEINAPLGVVADFASDPDNTPRWYANISSITWETTPPVAVGSRMAFVAHFLGRRLSYTYEVRELVPHERLVMSTSQGPFPMQTTYTWTALDDRRTLMTLRNQGEPSGLGHIAAPLMAAAMKRATTKDLLALQAILESP